MPLPSYLILLRLVRSDNNDAVLELANLLLSMRPATTAAQMIQFGTSKTKMSRRCVKTQLK